MKIFLKKHALDFLGNLLMCGPNKIKHWMEKKTISWNMIHSTSLTLTTNNLGAVCLAVYPISASSMLDLPLIPFTAYSACLVMSV